MKLNEFLHSNNDCPVCGKRVGLYLSVLQGPVWKANEKTGSFRSFNQIMCKNDQLSDNDIFAIIDDEVGCELKYSNHSMLKLAKDWKFFLFKLCNEQSIEEESNTSYSIDPYKACYYCTSPCMSLRVNENDLYEFNTTPEETTEGSFRDEIFIFKILEENSDEKLYILNLDYENKNTILRFCNTTLDQRSDESFEPKMFKKELPLMSVRPNFDLSERDKLISRLDSWILMS